MRNVRKVQPLAGWVLRRFTRSAFNFIDGDHLDACRASILCLYFEVCMAEFGWTRGGVGFHRESREKGDPRIAAVQRLLL